jgi:hypothetical protein
MLFKPPHNSNIGNNSLEGKASLFSLTVVQATVDNPTTEDPKDAARQQSRFAMKDMIGDCQPQTPTLKRRNPGESLIVHMIFFDPPSTLGIEPPLSSGMSI